MATSSEWVLLARIVRPQGRKGEVLAELFTDFPERFGGEPEVWLAANGFSAGAASGNPEAAKVSAYWLPVGRNAGRVVLQFAGIDSISAAERLTGKEVVVPAELRRSLEEGAFYISDLVGCTVYDGDDIIGTVADVQFATTPDGSRRLEETAPLLALQAASGEEILIPFAKEYLVAVDTSAKVIRMKLPAGLREVNASGADADSR